MKFVKSVYSKGLKGVILLDIFKLFNIPSHINIFYVLKTKYSDLKILSFNHSRTCKTNFAKAKKIFFI